MTALLPAPARRIALFALTCCAVFVGATGTVVLRLRGPQRLDSTINGVVVRAVGEHQNALRVIAGLGQKVEVGALTLILVGLCLALRRLDGALLAAVAIPVAPVLTEYVFKPLFARPDAYGTFPSGHTTAAFAMATVVGILLATPGKGISGAWRLATALAALLTAAAVAVAVIGLGMHTLTDALGGAAVGAGVALSAALLLDLPLVRRLLTRERNQPQRWAAAGAGRRARLQRLGRERTTAADLPGVNRGDSEAERFSSN
jgi:membrane-associated phospholipid phosphatase